MALQNFIEITSNMIYTVALGVGLKCLHKIHLNTQCQGGGRFCPTITEVTPKNSPWLHLWDEHSMIGIVLANLSKMLQTMSPYVPADLHICLMTPFTEGTLLTHKNALRITIDLLRPISFSSFLIKIGVSIYILMCY